MKLRLYRNYYRDNYIIGKLFIEDDFFCDTLEPSLTAEHPCIPVGNYNVVINEVSTKFKNRSPYNTFCKGFLPRLKAVPNRSGILIHIGNTSKDTQGCILVGRNTEVGKVLFSTKTFMDLYRRMQTCVDVLHGSIRIHISNVPLDSYSRKLLKNY